jgi:glyoxylase-like metal-dependent hydrolase (beta-lactamase superfamily II)
MSLKPAVSIEKGAAKIVVALDPESVRKMINIVELLKGAEPLEEIGSTYMVLRVPRLARFMGYRRARLDYKVYEAGDASILVAKGGVDSLILAIDIIDTGEGAHIVVSGGGAGGAAKVVDSLVKHVAEKLAEKIESASPLVELVPEDNKLASLTAVLPGTATLSYYDSFTPVRNTVLEAAQRVLAILGPDDYLVEVSDYRGSYLLRLVLRGNRVTGIYAEVEGEKAEGSKALSIAARPPGYRVRIKAWSLTGSAQVFLFEAEPLYVEENHKVYWIGGSAKPDYGGIVSNSYIILSGYEALVMDPSGGEYFVRGLRNVVQDLEQLKHIVVSAAEADIGIALQFLVEKAPHATINASPYWGSVLAPILPNPGQVNIVPARTTPLHIGDGEVTLIPNRARGVVSLSLYDPRSRILFAGNALGAVSPPGLWNIFVENLEEYTEMVRAYLWSSADMDELRKWLEEIQGLDIAVLAPRHGPLLRGKEKVAHLLETISKW